MKHIIIGINPITIASTMQILQTLCCWGTDCCKCQLLQLSRNQNIKLAYILLTLLTLLVTTLVSRSPSSLQPLIPTFNCSTNSVQQSHNLQCARQQLLFRWLLAIAVVHLGLMIVVMLRNHLSKIANEGIWLIKVGLVVGLGFLFMYAISDSFMYVVQVVAAYVTPFWYFVQSLIIVDLIYSIDGVFKQWTDNHPKLAILKAFLSLSLIMGSVTLNILSYLHTGTPNPTLYISILSSIQIFSFLLLCLLRIAKSNTLFVYGLVMLYLNAMAYFLQCSDQQEQGQGQGQEGPGHGWVQIGMVVVCLGGILSTGSNRIRTRKSSVNQILALNTSKEQQDNRYVSTNKWIIFHLIFTLILLSLPFTLHQSGQSFYYSPQGTNTWVHTFKVYRIVGWFMGMGIYLWTIVAAKLYPEQDFDQLENYFKEFQLN